MEDNASLNRRSNLHTRIVPDRPAQQEKQLIWETIAEDKTNAPLKEQQITRTIRKYTNKQREQHHARTTAQKEKRNTRRGKEAKTKRGDVKEKETKTVHNLIRLIREKPAQKSRRKQHPTKTKLISQ